MEELLTYKQAAELLQCSYQAISVAVSESRLTVVKIKRGSRLLRRQVELFQGKRGISERFLTLDELSTWKECKQTAFYYKDIASKDEHEAQNMLAANRRLDNSIARIFSLLEELKIEVKELKQHPYQPLPYQKLSTESR